MCVCGGGGGGGGGERTGLVMRVQAHLTVHAVIVALTVTSSCFMVLYIHGNCMAF